MIRFWGSPTVPTSTVPPRTGIRRCLLAAAVLALLATTGSRAMAASGDLDTGFSTDGLVLQTFTGTGSQVANAVAADGNGKVVVAGTKSTNTAAFGPPFFVHPLRSFRRTRVSFATVATCVPSSANTYPRANPRPFTYAWQFISNKCHLVMSTSRWNHTV